MERFQSGYIREVAAQVYALGLIVPSVKTDSEPGLPILLAHGITKLELEFSVTETATPDCSRPLLKKPISHWQCGLKYARRIKQRAEKHDCRG